jgi:O-antigen ligase
MRSQIGTAALTPAQVAPIAGWDLLLLCLAVHMMIAVGRIHQLFPFLLPLKPAIVTGVAAIIFYLVQQRGLRRLTFLGSPTTTCVVLLLVWATLSIPGALYPRAAFDLVTDRFIKTVLLYLLIVGAVRSVADVERLAFVYFLAAATYAAVILLTFDVGQGSWRLSHIYYYDANDFATFAVTALPLGLHFVLGQRKWLGRLVGAVGLMVLTTAFVWSGSRGGFLAIVAVVVWVLLRYSTIPGRWRLLGVGVITVVFLTTASEQYWTQMNTIFDSQGDYNRTEDEGRIAIWKRGMGYAAQHPVLGVGADNFPVAEGTISPLASRQTYGLGVVWGAAHNSYVQVAAELGVPGLLFFIVALGTAFGALRDISRRSRGNASLAQALTASLVGFVIGAYFLSLAYHEMVYALLALAAGLRKVTLLRTPAPKPTRVIMGRHPRATMGLP